MLSEATEEPLPRLAEAVRGEDELRDTSIGVMIKADAAGRTIAPAAARTALIITDPLSQISGFGQQIKDILMEEYHFEENNIEWIELSPEGSITDEEKERIEVAKARADGVFVYIMDESIGLAVSKGILKDMAIDLSGTPQDELEAKIREQMASAMASGTSL